LKEKKNNENLIQYTGNLALLNNEILEANVIQSVIVVCSVADVFYPKNCC
jgi:hypothetical protein